MADSGSGRHLLRGPLRLRCTAVSGSQRISCPHPCADLVRVCICLWPDCQYLLSSPLKDGQEMSEEEQQRVFGLQSPDQKRATGGRASGDQRHDDIMLAAGIDQPTQAAAAAAAAAAAVDGDMFADME